MRNVPALLLVLLAGCGGASDIRDATGTASEPIINGAACASGVANTAVAIIARFTATNSQQQMEEGTEVTCTGTLIAPDTVVSAAHCVDPSIYSADLNATITSLSFYISYQTDLSSVDQSMTLPSDAVLVQAVAENPSFSPSNGAGLQNFHDVSLLFLSVAQTVQPEILIQSSEASQIADQAPVEIAGWGQTADSETAPAGVKECGASFINQLGTTEMQIGAGSTTSYACHGDSGGPAYMNITTPYNIKRRLIGITSHAYDDAYCDQGAVDTRMDAYLDWINTTMIDACSNFQRVWCNEPGILTPSFYQSTPNTSPSGGDTTNGTGPGSPVLPTQKSGCGSVGMSVWALAGLLMRRRSRR